MAFDKGKREICSVVFQFALLFTHVYVQRFICDTILENSERLPTVVVGLITTITGVSVQMKGGH